MTRDSKWYKDFYKKHCVEYGLMIFYRAAVETQGYMLGISHAAVNKLPAHTNHYHIFVPEEEFLDRWLRKGSFGENLIDCRRNPPQGMPILKKFTHYAAINDQTDLNPDACNNADELFSRRGLLLKRWITAAKPFFDAYDNSSHWYATSGMLWAVVEAARCLNRRYLELGLDDFEPYFKIVRDFADRGYFISTPKSTKTNNIPFRRCEHCNQALHNISENDKCPNCEHPLKPPLKSKPNKVLEENEAINISVWKVTCPQCLAEFTVPQNNQTDFCSDCKCAICNFQWDKVSASIPLVLAKTSPRKCSTWTIDTKSNTLILFDKIKNITQEIRKSEADKKELKSAATEFKSTPEVITRNSFKKSTDSKKNITDSLKSAWKITCPECLTNFVVPKTNQIEACTHLACDVCSFAWEKIDAEIPPTLLKVKNFNYNVCELNDKTKTLVLFGRSKAAATPEEVNTRSAEPSRTEKYTPKGSYHGSWITKCKQCNKAISVSTGDKAAVCPQCKTPFFNHI